MTQPEALTAGATQDTPLGALLCWALKRELTGSLVLAETPERVHAMALKDGFPCKVRLVDVVDRVGDILVGAGVLTAEQIPAVAAQSKSAGVPFGHAAIQLGFTTMDGINQALSAQVLRRGARLFGINTGTYGFYAEDFLASFGGPDNPVVDPLAMISTGVRASYNLVRLTQLLADVAGRPIQLVARPETIERFRFNDEEQAVTAVLVTPQTLQDVIGSAGQAPLTAHVVIHCLHAAGMLELGEPVHPPVAAAAQAPLQSPVPPGAVVQQPLTTTTPSQAPPPITTTTPSQAPPPMAEPAPEAAVPDGEKSERRLEAESLIDKGEDATYFELLGVSSDAASGELQKAYIKRARQFHPDRATGDLADLRPHMADLFARISLAHQTLKDPEKRREYEATLDLKAEQGGDGSVTEEEVVRKAIEADEAFMKAKIFLRMNNVAEAEDLSQFATEAEPDNGDYAALAIWIEARKRARTDNIDDLLVRLTEAVEKVPNSEDAHFYLAQLLYRDGRVRKALKEYRAVMNLNKHNIDAVRMVRILRRKIEQTPKKKSAKSGGGLFGSLFGDKKK